MDSNNAPDSESQSSEQQTQSTQPASQQEEDKMPKDMWGYLEPCNREASRIAFYMNRGYFKLGRCKDTNDYVLPQAYVSLNHCIVTWNGQYEDGSVLIRDISRNGTYLNGIQMGRGNLAVLRTGSDVSFHRDGSLRYIYRHLANRRPITATFQDKYDVLSDLGKGSYGLVKKAVCRSTGEYVAVKILKDTKTISNQITRPTIREIEILQKLKHKNICELKEAFILDEYDDISTYITLVLELVEGGDLFAYLFRHGPLSESNSKYFTYQICDALAYIHSRNVAHRDLKPENILLTKDNPPVVKVADFGLAKSVNSQTMLKTMCGSPAYIAPEIIMEGGYSDLVDSWCVGVMVYIMLVGKSPFVEDENRDLRTRVLYRSIDWKSLGNPYEDNSPKAIDFIYCLLQTDPKLRMTLTDALEHPWLKNYRPFYDHEFGSSDDVRSANVHSGFRANLPTRFSDAYTNSRLPGNAADDDVGLISKVLDECVHVAPMPSQRDAHVSIQYSHRSLLGSGEYPPGLLKAREDVVEDERDDDGDGDDDAPQSPRG